MPTISLADGQNLGIVGLTFTDLSNFIFENGGTPAGCLKGTGNPPAWIEFSAQVSPNTGRVRVKQSNVVTVVE